MTWFFGDYSAMDEFLTRIIAIAWVVLPIFTAFTLFFKRKAYLLLGLVAALGLFLMTEDKLPQEDVQLLMLWGFSFYSLIFLLPFWKKNPNNGFWNYCAQIFFVLVLGFVCSGILAISLQLALESIRSLFEVDLDYRWNETVMFFSFFFVLPVFVHVGLPMDWQPFEKDTNYPTFFRPLSYYLLTPISILFFGILGAYMLKILFTWEWPSGQVAYPVLYLAFVTFAFYLISYPWRKNWQRLFFVVLIPFLVMYFAALGMRIEQYGLTEFRYMGIVLGICLIFMSAYFAFVNRQRLQMMLLPLTIVAFIFAIGSWGFSEVPIRSQEARLEAILTEVGALKDGKLLAVDANLVSQDKVVSMSSIVEYLYQRNRLDDLQSWTNLDLSDEAIHGYLPETFMTELGFSYQPYAWEEYRDLYFEYGLSYVAESSIFDISDYDSLVEFSVNQDPYMGNKGFNTFNFAEEGVTLTMTTNEAGLISISNGITQIDFDLLAFEQNLQKLNSANPYTFEPELMSFEAENKDMKIRIYISNMHGAYKDEARSSFENFTVWGKLLISLR